MGHSNSVVFIVHQLHIVSFLCTPQATFKDKKLKKVMVAKAYWAMDVEPEWIQISFKLNKDLTVPKKMMPSLLSAIDRLQRKKKSDAVLEFPVSGRRRIMMLAWMTRRERLQTDEVF